MGMYTELILGCEISTTNPQVIRVLQYLFGENVPEPLKEDLPDHPFFRCDRWHYIASMSSFYFGVAFSTRRMDRVLDYKDKFMLSSRSSIKNYDQEIEKFLDWLLPYIVQGSGVRDFYAIVTYEEQAEPTIYYLNETQRTLD